MPSTSSRRSGPLVVALAAGLLCLAEFALAQAKWPQRPVRIIVVYPTGGVSDETARAIAERLAPRLEVPVLVENRAGGGGSVGMGALAKAQPDGHTLAFSAISPLTLNPYLAAVGYDPRRDVAPVIGVMHTPVVVVGTPAFAGATFQDLLRAARQAPGRVRWGSSGIATVGHMVLEHVRLAAQVDISHIPYKGGGQQLTDALAGHFEILSTNVAIAQLQHIQSGKFKALAVGAPERLRVLPQVPTLAELGFAQANLTSLFGLFAPGDTPEAIIARLNAELNAVLRQGDVRERLVAANNLPFGGSAAEFARAINLDAERNLAVIRAAGIRAE
ncbi:MAG: tripartite tricarboxylate transporter substrate binding protein [Burkholderiales bacterium]|nr:tripartite tricarboxylate transporter substrate binding protein [Burkholderiales bacterium]